MLMPSLADFNFSGDDPGPSTDPTVDPVDADPMSEGQPTGEESYDDTNYKEPGAGEEFLGNEPTSFDSEGNADNPNIQRSDVTPIEVENPQVTETKTTNPVERDLEEGVEEALELLLNLGLKDFVLGTINEILEDKSELDPEEIGMLQRIKYWIDDLELKEARRNIDRAINYPNTVVDQMSDDFFEGVRTELGIDDYYEDLRRARANIDSLIPNQNNFWKVLQRNALKLHNIFNKADDEDLIDEGEDQGDIDEAQGSLSPNDPDLEFIDLDDWLGADQSILDNVDYTDLNDYLAPDMHTVDEYIDLNDYLGDMIQESFLEEFMYVEQDDI